MELNDILKRADSYRDKQHHELVYYLNNTLDQYLVSLDGIRNMVQHNGGRRSNIGALTKAELIMMILALTQKDYEAIVALPHAELPLLINKSWAYPDQEVLFNYRLKNG